MAEWSKCEVVVVNSQNQMKKVIWSSSSTFTVRTQRVCVCVSN